MHKIVKEDKLIPLHTYLRERTESDSVIDRVAFCGIENPCGVVNVKISAQQKQRQYPNHLSKKKDSIPKLKIRVL